MADIAGEEREPLLQNDHNNAFNQQYGGSHGPDTLDFAGTTVSPLGPDEVPPPYTPSPQGGTPMVTCRVCQALIDISGKRDQHVVKCSNCNEATPIKTAPPGKKYVRCPCNCLLICKVTSQRIACPRQNCKRIINLSPSTASSAMPTVPGMCRVTCAHCVDTFLFNTLNNSLARCPHCRKVSSVGPEFARYRALIFIVLGLVVLAIAVGLTVGTFKMAKKSPVLYVSYVVFYVLAVGFFSRCVIYVTMKVSVVEGPA